MQLWAGYKVLHPSSYGLQTYKVRSTSVSSCGEQYGQSDDRHSATTRQLPWICLLLKRANSAVFSNGVLMIRNMKEVQLSMVCLQIPVY